MQHSSPHVLDALVVRFVSDFFLFSFPARIERIWFPTSVKKDVRTSETGKDIQNEC